MDENRDQVMRDLARIFKEFTSKHTMGILWTGDDHSEILVSTHLFQALFEEGILYAHKYVGFVVCANQMDLIFMEEFEEDYKSN